MYRSLSRSNRFISSASRPLASSQLGFGSLFNRNGLQNQEQEHGQTPEVTIPEKLNIPQDSSFSAEEKYNSPFTSFTNLYVLNVALKPENSNKYNHMITVKDERLRTSLDLHENLSELMLKYPSRFFPQLKVYNEKKLEELSKDLHKPAHLKQEAIDRFAGDIHNFINENNRYSHFQVISGLLSYCMKDNSFKESYLDGVVKEVNENLILFFTISELETIINQLIEIKSLNSINLIIAQFENVNETEFTNSISPILKIRLVEFFTQEQDFQNAFTYIGTLISDDKIAPNREIAENYLKLVDSTALRLNSTFDNKKVIFNYYAKPLSVILRNIPESTEIIKIILKWISNYNELISFLRYAGIINMKIPSYDVVQRFSEIVDTDNIQKSINLTSLVNTLECDLHTKKLIAKLYAKFKSPIAAAHYIKQIDLTAEEKQELICLLTDSSSESIQGITGTTTEFIDKVVKSLQ